MEFTLVTSHEGVTLEHNMRTMGILYVHPEYLIHLDCVSIDEYIQSIVHVTTNTPHEQLISEVQTHKFSTAQGSIVFRNIRTGRSAIISYQSDNVAVDHPSKTPPYQICLTKVRGIQWQDNTRCAEWLAHVEAKMCLDVAECATVCRDDQTYVAIAAHDLPSLADDDLRRELKILKCQLDVNQPFDHRIVRAHLITKSLFETQKLHPCRHNGSWTILSMQPSLTDAYILEMSPTLATRLRRTAQDISFRQVLENNQTVAQINRFFLEIMPDMRTRDIGSTGEYTMTFVCDRGFENVVVHILKTRTLYVWFLA